MSDLPQLRGIQPPPRPAERGNLRAAVHGARSVQLVMPAADALAEILYAEVPHLAAEDALAVRDYCIAQIRAWRFAAYIEEHGEFAGRGAVRPAVGQLRVWLERAEKARARLGLDPLSRSRLRLDTIRAVDVLGELEEGRRLREAADRRTELANGVDQLTAGTHEPDGGA